MATLATESGSGLLFLLLGGLKCRVLPISPQVFAGREFRALPHDLLPGFNRPKHLSLDKSIWKSICFFCEFELFMMDSTLSLDHLVDMARG